MDLVLIKDSRKETLYIYIYMYKLYIYRVHNRSWPDPRGKVETRSDGLGSSEPPRLSFPARMPRVALMELVNIAYEDSEKTGNPMTFEKPLGATRKEGRTRNPQKVSRKPPWISRPKKGKDLPKGQEKTPGALSKWKSAEKGKDLQTCGVQPETTAKRWAVTRSSMGFLGETRKPRGFKKKSG